MLSFILARAREPSSYAGIAALLSAAGIPLRGDVFDAAVTAATALAGLVALLLPETKGGTR